MQRRFRIAYFAHAIRSDWNNGNAHFLRGLLRSLLSLGHEVLIFEPESEWSMRGLLEESRGRRSLEQFGRMYPELTVVPYGSDAIGDAVFWREILTDVDVAIVHEWNPPKLAHCLLALRDEFRMRLLFHDTHHRASSSPEQIDLMGIPSFDGVLAFGEALSAIYRERFGIKNVWTFHEAADTSVFHPIDGRSRATDCVWIGNWGDGERSTEIRQFFLCPASKRAERRFRIYGVRYPEEGLAALKASGVEYCSYLPNLDAPRVYAESGLTIHIPRQQYTRAMTGIPTIRVFEALACGIPLISAPWVDTEGLFREGDFVWANSCEQMTSAMDELLENTAAAKAQALRGLQTVLARHTCAHRAEQLTSIIEELVP